MPKNKQEIERQEPLQRVYIADIYMDERGESFGFVGGYRWEERPSDGWEYVYEYVLARKLRVVKTVTLEEAEDE